MIGVIGVAIGVVALLAITAVAGREPLSGAKPILPGVLAQSRSAGVSPSALVLIEGAALIALLAVAGAFISQRPRRQKQQLPIGRLSVLRWSTREAGARSRSARS